MCGRFVVSTPKDIKGKYNISNSPPLFSPNYNVSPSTKALVVTKNSPNKLILMKWGFELGWDKTKSLINVRSETAIEKPYFNKFLKETRCIIPVNGFYEWGQLKLETKKEKYPFFFYSKKQEFLSLGGLYTQKEGKYSFAILTTKANSLMKPVHDRMPVIIKEEDTESWLSSKTKDKIIQKFLEPVNPSFLKFHPVSKYVNDPKNNSPDLIKPFN